MPLYDCECAGCGNIEEFILKRDECPPPCQHCDGNRVRVPVQGGSSFELKGHGWFKDGYSDYIGDMMPKHMHGKKYQ